MSIRTLQTEKQCISIMDECMAEANKDVKSQNSKLTNQEVVLQGYRKAQHQMIELYLPLMDEYTKKRAAHVLTGEYTGVKL